MKVIIKAFSIAIILLGLIHTYVAFFCHYMDEDNLWFLGSGFAVIFAGLLNFIAAYKVGSKLTAAIALVINLIMCTMFFYALPILNNTQIYIGTSLFALASVLSLINGLKYTNRASGTNAAKADNISQDNALTDTKTIPMLRIFDKAKAIEFYVNWLGFSVDWEHTFTESRPPVYMQVSRSGIVIHLTEHHGDCTPGGKVYIECKGLRDYHRKLIDKKYPYNAPGLETAPWKSLCMEVVDPFGNKLLFSEAQ